MKILKGESFQLKMYYISLLSIFGFFIYFLVYKESNWIEASFFGISILLLFLILPKPRNKAENDGKFLSKLIDHLPLALYCKDYTENEGKFISWNKGAESLWGLNFEDVFNRTDADFFPKEQADEFQRLDLATLKKGEEVFVEEEKVTSPNTDNVYVRTWKVPLISGHNKYLLAISQNITELRMHNLVQKEVSKLRDYYLKNSDNLNLIQNMILSSFFRVTESEYGFISTFESINELENSDDFKVTTVNSFDGVQKFKEEVPLNNQWREKVKLIATNKNFLIENENINSQFQSHDIKNFIGIPILISKNVCAVIGLLNKEEGYSEKFYASLNPMVEAVTDIFSMNMLHEESKKNKEIAFHNSKLASIGEISGGIGHEINNPLAIIAGNFFMIKKEIKKSNFENEKINTFIEKSEIAVKRIEKIVGSLKLFIRSETEKSEVFSMSKIVNQSLGLFEDLLKKSLVKLELEIGCEDCMAYGLEGRFQQVIFNLLGNARDSFANMERKDRKVFVSLKKINNNIQLIVKDNGCGIDEKVKDKIFNNFFTTKEVGKGTGMGLAISQSIIHAMKGTITCTSTLGEGTKFEVLLPCYNQSIHDLTINSSDDKKDKDQKVS